MDSIKQVCIGIQARSTSHRFPRKVFELIGDKSMLRHVIDTCDKAAFYLNRYELQSRFRTKFAVLCPKGDEIVDYFERVIQDKQGYIIEGPEDDVLARYVGAAKITGAAYMVRVTGDCPLIPYHLISKAIKLAIVNQYDYCSNVDERIRTSVDGYDVEVISRRALLWMDENVKDPSLREHVTQILRTDQTPKDFVKGTMTGYLNQSHIKLSVDTVEDLERVRIEYQRIKIENEKAVEIYGKNHVHKF